jgi:hypothetical protein
LGTDPVGTADDSPGDFLPRLFTDLSEGLYTVVVREGFGDSGKATLSARKVVRRKPAETVLKLDAQPVDGLIDRSSPIVVDRSTSDQSPYELYTLDPEIDLRALAESGTQLVVEVESRGLYFSVDAGFRTPLGFAVARTAEVPLDTFDYDTTFTESVAQAASEQASSVKYSLTLVPAEILETEDALSDEVGDWDELFIRVRTTQGSEGKFNVRLRKQDAVEAALEAAAADAAANVEAAAAALEAADDDSVSLEEPSADETADDTADDTASLDPSSESN